MVSSLKGKVVLITGATRGLGLQAAIQLGEIGATVIIGGRDARKLDDAVTALRNKDISAEGIVLDVTVEKDRELAREYIESKYGVLDVLVNNAGVWLESANSCTPPEKITSNLSQEVLRATMEANFFAPVALTQLLLPLIKKSQAGRIVNVSSVLGSLALHADPESFIYQNKIFAYNTSKVALNSFTIHLAHELLGTSVKVNSIHPGWVRSEIGGPGADLPIEEGAHTTVRFATLPEDGPTGGFFYLESALPW